MNYSQINAIVLVLSITGISLILYVAMDAIVSFVIKVFEGTPGRRMARRIKEAGLGKEKKESEAKIQAKVHAIRNRIVIPSWIIAIVALLSGVLFLYTRSILSFGLVLLYYGAQKWIISYMDHKEAKDVWAFMLDLRIRLSTKGSLYRALQEVAEEERTNLAKILAIYIKWNIEGDSLSLLSRISADTGLPYIDDVVLKSKAAKEGNLSIEEAFQLAIENIQDEIDTVLREQLQNIPARLMIIVIPLLLGPALVLLVIPVVAQLLASLSYSS